MSTNVKQKIGLITQCSTGPAQDTMTHVHTMLYTYTQAPNARLQARHSADACHITSTRINTDVQNVTLAESQTMTELVCANLKAVQDVISFTLRS